jgi:hypothetical protein
MSNIHCIRICLSFFFFLVVFEIEPCACYSHAFSPFLLQLFFRLRLKFLPGASLDHDPPTYTSHIAEM